MRRVAAIAVGGLLSLAVVAPAGAAVVVSPTVEGPIPADAIGSASRDYPFGSSVQDLASRGYVEREFFYSGTTSVGDYKTRMLVRRPADPAKFSGTVIVEWTNVTNLYDLEALWVRSAEHVMREGDAYVALDVQTAGVTSPVSGLKAWSPERYGSLFFPQVAAATTGANPGPDAGMFEIFGQGLQAIRNPEGVDPLGGLKPKTLLATGCSQSALYMWMYAQDYDPHDGLTDGFLITEASTSTLGLMGQTSAALPLGPTVTPVLWLNTETDSSYRRQPDSSWFRLWEVAGTTHLDRDARDVQEVIVRRDFDKDVKALIDCEHRPFSRIPFRYAQNAAVEALEDWVASGAPPRSRPTFAYDGDGVLVRDGFENVLGGVRLPQFEVPVANDSRENTGACKALYGRSVPFSAARLRVLYPTHEDYLAKLREATAAAVKAGDLLEPDAEATMAAARTADPPVERSAAGTTSAPTPAPAPAAECRSRRVVALRFPRRARGRRVTGVRVGVAGRRPIAVRSRRLNLSLAGYRQGIVEVRIVLRLSGGGTKIVRRRFATCLARA